jgi:predicted Rdx family selenoprotein
LNGTAHTAEIHEGAKNQFDVIADDDIVFSKEREGRFPEIGEILAALPATS